MNTKDELIEILDYYKMKLKRDGCTMAEIESAKNSLIETMNISGTLDDFADFYGKSKVAVSSQIKRNLIDKPKKNVTLYPFHKFRKIVPPSWRRKD